MGDHYRIDSRSDGAAEGRKFDGIEMGAVDVDAGHAEMRIGGGVPVAGKMFDGGEHAAFMRALDVGCDQIADLRGIFSKRTRVDDGIDGVRVDVGIGKEIPVNTDGAGLFGSDASEGFGVFEFAVATEGHGVRKNGGTHQAHGDAAFEIRREEKRELRLALQAIEQFGGFVRLAA